MQVVLHLDGRVDAQPHRHHALPAIGTGDDQLGVGLWLDGLTQFDADGLVALQAQGRPNVAAQKLQGQYAHADEVGAVNALKTASDHGLDPQQLSALGRPIPA